MFTSLSHRNHRASDKRLVKLYKNVELLELRIRVVSVCRAELLKTSVFVEESDECRQICSSDSICQIMLS